MEQSDFLLQDTHLGHLEAQYQLGFEGSVDRTTKENAAGYLLKIQWKILVNNDKVLPRFDLK